jgi:lipopolysaccharide transport system ATP-binding protein
MRADLAMLAEGVSKKYCKSLRRSVLYGLKDVGRNFIGLGSRSETLRPEEFWALENASFEVLRGESVGLIGPNGSGKTTLLKLMNGIFWPDRGKLAVRGRMGALIAVGAGFHPLLTGRENVHINAAILGMRKAEVDAAFDAIVDFAEIGEFLDTPVKHYSSGMYVRLGFAIAVHSRPDILLVDEVLAVGDRGFQAKCFKKMGELRKQGTTFVVVSHNTHVVAGFADWVLLLEHGRAERHDDVFEGIRRYARLFGIVESADVERLVSRGAHVEFSDVDLGSDRLAPGDSLTIKLPYQCTRAYDDVEVDIAVYDLRDPDLYFQATNRAYGRRIDLSEGRHELSIRLCNLQMSGTHGRVTLAIWAPDRTEQLFWWRFPVEFSGRDYATGKNFFPVDFEVSA